MTGHKKKLVAFLVAVALVSGGFVAVSVKSATEKSEAEKSKIEAGSIFASDPTGQIRNSGSPGRELFFKTMLAVLLVIALGVAAIYTSRKLLPRITNLPGKQIRILETIHLGPKKAVHLIEIGNQKLLIGSTNENITMLADLTG